jgi:hypothetical protein
MAATAGDISGFSFTVARKYPWISENNTNKTEFTNAIKKSWSNNSYLLYSCFFEGKKTVKT